MRAWRRARTRPACVILKHTVSVEPAHTSIASEPVGDAEGVLARWNTLPASVAADSILACCGSRAWAVGLAARRPISSRSALVAHSDEVWMGLAREDWQQAFDSHPRLGELHAKAATTASLEWSKQEQSRATPNDALREANARYEHKFGHIFLLCASGRTAPEILAALELRMENDAASEWLESAEQQRQITRLRLERWLRET